MLGRLPFSSSGSALAMLELYERRDELFERLGEVCLVEYKQRILSEQSGVERASLVAGAIAGEEQSRADEVDGADDNCGAGGVARPFAVVGELAAKGRNRRWFTFEVVMHPLRERAVAANAAVHCRLAV